MKRRAFFGLLGGAVVAGPQAAKSAAQMTLADVRLTSAGMGVPGSGYGSSIAATTVSNGSWASDALKRLIGKTAAQVDMEKRRQYVDALDPQIASLRSVALHRKVAMQRDVSYARSQDGEKGYLEGVIAGWWS